MNTILKKVDGKFNYLYTYKNIKCDGGYIIDHVNIYDFYNTNARRYLIFIDDLNPFKDYEEQASSDHVCLNAYETLEEARNWCEKHQLMNY